MAFTESNTPNDTVARFFSCIDVLSLLMAFQAEHSVSRITVTAWPVDSLDSTRLIKVKNSYFRSGRLLEIVRAGFTVGSDHGSGNYSGERLRG
jgi:hypothetical protein